MNALLSPADKEAAAMAASLVKLHAKASPLMADLLNLLAHNLGSFVSHEKVTAHLWGKDPHGGPLFTSQAISSIIRYNAKLCRQHGWKISRRMGRHGGVRLDRMPLSRRDGE